MFKIKNDIFKVVKVFYPFIKPYRKLLFLSIFLLVFASLAGLYAPWVTKDIVNLLETEEGIQKLFTIGIRYFYIIIILFVIQAVLGYFQIIIISKVGEGFVRDIRSYLFAHLIDLPVDFFDRNRAGDLSSRASNDISTIQEMFTNGSHTIVMSMINIFGSAFIMFYISVKLSLVTLVLIPLLILMVMIFGKRVRRFSKGLYEMIGKMSSKVQEAASQIRIVKAFSQESKENSEFSDIADSSYNFAMKRAYTLAIFSSLNQIFIWGSIIAVFVFGFILVKGDFISSGELVSFILYSFKILIPLVSLAFFFASIQRTIAAGIRIIEILDTPVEKIRYVNKLKPESLKGTLIFDRVSFAYNGSDVIKDLDLIAEEREFIGIVGTSGAGKSTIASLILGFYPARSGRICIDGYDYNDLDLYHIRRFISYVPQEPQLFGGTLLENIKYGCPGATMPEIEDAVKKARIYDFIKNLPNGYNTEVGERGVKLSGGERQRIAIARAFLKDPKILIMDEATSHLDLETERDLRTASYELLKGRTTIMIAHRLSTTRDADRIVVLADGKKVEEGNHAELMERRAVYYNLYNLNNSQ